MAISLSSGGLIFPGTFADATNVNTMDDYEEGKVTDPILKASGNGNAAWRESNFHIYVRCGKFISMNWHARITNIDGGSGGLLVALPVTAQNYGAYAIRTYNISFNTSYRQAFGVHTNDLWGHVEEYRSGTTSDVFHGVGYWFSSLNYQSPYDSDWPT